MSAVMADGGPPCSTHPAAPHGFDRNASHGAGRYVCDCEGFKPEADPRENDGSTPDNPRPDGSYGWPKAHSNPPPQEAHSALDVLTRIGDDLISTGREDMHALAGELEQARAALENGLIERMAYIGVQSRALGASEEKVRALTAALANVRGAA
jgi:hypothetical protein